MTAGLVRPVTTTSLRSMVGTPAGLTGAAGYARAGSWAVEFSGPFHGAGAGERDAVTAANSRD
ncbi:MULTISPECIES: hypothetical protein [Protofrankia]|uniref:Uncharacterized protein n=1 Tax=Candidatus Protofrankia datiscae TaxID=2716812 RepID=F8B362_9ACTN|nr:MULTISPECIES: hypothetical protein [Protofrankia]AEH09975.1 hypothetical protein FsymDg_2618 [Candidatus Protofrankia datiscae]